jgi:RAB protein geranylgeranyltransferase component A
VDVVLRGTHLVEVLRSAYLAEDHPGP